MASFTQEMDSATFSVISLNNFLQKYLTLNSTNVNNPLLSNTNQFRRTISIASSGTINIFRNVSKILFLISATVCLIFRDIGFHLLALTPSNLFININRAFIRLVSGVTVSVNTINNLYGKIFNVTSPGILHLYKNPTKLLSLISPSISLIVNGSVLTLSVLTNNISYFVRNIQVPSYLFGNTINVSSINFGYGRILSITSSTIAKFTNFYPLLISVVSNTTNTITKNSNKLLNTLSLVLNSLKVQKTTSVLMYILGNNIITLSKNTGKLFILNTSVQSTINYKNIFNKLLLITSSVTSSLLKNYRLFLYSITTTISVFAKSYSLTILGIVKSPIISSMQIGNVKKLILSLVSPIIPVLNKTFYQDFSPTVFVIISPTINSLIKNVHKTIHYCGPTLASFIKAISLHIPLISPVVPSLVKRMYQLLTTINVNTTIIHRDWPFFKNCNKKNTYGCNPLDKF